MSDILRSNNLNIHDILINEALRIKDNKVGVFSSGGIDSWSVVFALLEIGKKVHIYSFTLDDRESKDFLKAKELSEYYKLEFTPIYLSTNLSKLETDIYTLARDYDCRKKVEFTCVWPFLHAYDLVEESVIGSGLCADGYFCISKSGMIHYRDKIDEFRERYFDNNGSQYLQHRMLAINSGKQIFIPYLSDDMMKFFTGKTWEECNTPKQKQIILNSFPKEFSNNKFDKHTNLHLGDSGIAELFDKLLTRDINRKHYKSIVGIFNDIVRSQENESWKLIFDRATKD